MNRQDKKHNIFKYFAKDLGPLDVTTEDGQYFHLPEAYICPLCLTIYRIEDIDHLTFEHVPPESVGGTGIVLTCKDCNSTCGYKADKALQSELQLTDFNPLNGNSFGKTRFNLDGVDFNGSFIYRNSTIHVTFDNKRNSPDTFEKYNQKLANVKEGWTINLNVPITDSPRDIEGANASLLKSAYLIAFWCLGYKYILHDAFNSIREQISKGIGSVPHSYIRKDNPMYELPYGLYKGLVDKKECLFVYYKIQLKGSDITHKVLTLLPSQSDCSGEVFQEIINGGIQNLTFQLVSKFTKWPYKNEII